MKEVKEIRCPTGPKRLFMKVLSEGEKPVYTEGNLLELSCQDCCRTLKREGYDIFRVLHRYAINAELAETCLQWNDGTETIKSEWV